MPSRLAGRRAFVTGGGSGIGRAACLRLAQEGARVAVADKRAALAEAVAEEIRAAGGEGLAVSCDVGDEAQVGAAVERTAREFAGLDALFANAGTAGAGWIHELTLEDWESVLRVNLTGVFLAAKHCIPHLLDAHGGSIVTTGSIAALVVGAGGSAASYAASKGGVLAMTRELAVIHAREGVRVNALCPGPLKTKMLMDFLDTEEKKQRRLVHVPMGRFGEAKEMAQAALYLASEESSYVTGTTFLVDGGITSAYVTPE